MREEGSDEVVLLLGGVWDRAGSWAIFDLLEAWSGDMAWGFSWGIVPSKSSARKSLEKVRLASSAKHS